MKKQVQDITSFGEVMQPQTILSDADAKNVKGGTDIVSDDLIGF